MKPALIALVCAFAIHQAIAAGSADVIRCSKTINEMLLPEVKAAREAIKKHNDEYDEKTDTFLKAFLYINVAKGKYIDEWPYLELQIDLERSERSAALVDAVAMIRDRAEKMGKIGKAMEMREKEREFFRKLRSDIEKILTEVSEVELKIDRAALAKTGDEFCKACKAYAIELGIEPEEGEPGATDNPDDAQRLREDH